MYAYTKNNPTTFTDPTGLCTVDGEDHNWAWCALHAIGLTSTLQERREWDEYNVTATGSNGQKIDWSTASSDQVDRAYNWGMSQMEESVVGATACASVAVLCKGGPGLANMAGGILGSVGPQFTSKTLWIEGDERVDVENPAPGKRAGQIHYQDSTGKYIYDVQSGRFQGLSETKNQQLLSRPEIQQAIQKGLKYLGM